MRKRFPDGKEICTECGTTWRPSTKYSTLCGDCFCPDSKPTLPDDFVWSGISRFTPEAKAECKKLLEEELAMAVPPIDMEEYFLRQPWVRKLFD